MQTDGLKCHDLLIENLVPKLSFNEKENYDEWKEKIKEKFIELSGLDDIALNACEPMLEIDKEEDKENYRQIDFSFYSEIGEVIACHMLIPKQGKNKYPVAITLQGHTSGYHISVGETKFDEDKKFVPHSSMALQAVEQGFIAVAIEQRGRGIRSAENTPFRRVQLDSMQNRCYYQTITGFLMGRTMLGERVWDVSKTIDVLSNFPECDLDEIVITGNSGGGTASYYSACFDERIKYCVPSCGFCSYKESILRFYHCSCNYIPHAYKYFDMQDLACLIAPRKLSIISGQLDPSFLAEGVKKGYETVKQIYKSVNEEENCNLIMMPLGHWWHAETVWPEIKRIMKK